MKIQLKMCDVIIPKFTLHTIKRVCEEQPPPNIVVQRTYVPTTLAQDDGLPPMALAIACACACAYVHVHVHVHVHVPRAMTPSLDLTSTVCVLDDFTQKHPN